MAQIPNPPQFEPNEREAVRLYKQRQFVEEVIRAIQQLNNEVSSSSSGSGGYPAQLGHAGI